MVEMCYKLKVFNYKVENCQNVKRFLNYNILSLTTWMEIFEIMRIRDMIFCI